MPHCEVVQNTKPYIYDEGSKSCFHSPTFLYCIIFFVLMLLYNGGSQASRKWHLMGAVCWRFCTRAGTPMDPMSQWTPVSPTICFDNRNFIDT